MTSSNLKAIAVIAAMFVSVLLSASNRAYGQGALVHGVGPVNRAMGGAGTAAPLDSIGAVHWNPGSISGLESNEMAFGLELLLADIDLTSTIGGVTSSTNGDAGVSIIPSVGWVQHLENSPLSVGLGVYGVAGFRNNMPMDANNPLLATGPIYADAEFMQIAPTVSWAASDRFAIGFAPTITTARITLDPLGPSVISPLPLDGTGNRVHFGGGFQVGAYFIANDFWRFGATFKSTQWFEEFRFFTPAGTMKFDMDYPMLVSVGTSYSGFRDWVIAFDARFHDFKNTDGFRELGWSSIFAGALGAQRAVGDNLMLRVGYNFNRSPIQDDDALANIATPLIQSANLSTGFSYRFACNVDLSMAYVYLVDNDITGPMPAGIFGPGATIRHDINAHSAVMGLKVSY